MSKVRTFISQRLEIEPKPFSFSLLRTDVGEENIVETVSAKESDISATIEKAMRLDLSGVVDKAHYTILATDAGGAAIAHVKLECQGLAPRTERAAPGDINAACAKVMMAQADQYTRLVSALFDRQDATIATLVQANSQQNSTILSLAERAFAEKDEEDDSFAQSRIVQMMTLAAPKILAMSGIGGAKPATGNSSEQPRPESRHAAMRKVLTEVLTDEEYEKIGDLVVQAGIADSILGVLSDSSRSAVLAAFGG